MEVLLVAPIKDARHILNLIPPLGLGYIATAAREEHNVKILDCVKEGLDSNSFLEYLRTTKPDLIGFTVFSCDLENVKKSIDLAKKVKPDIITVVGGSHVSGDPEGTFAYLENLDYAFIGEAEIGFVSLLNRLSKDFSLDKLSDIPGLAWRQNCQIRKNSRFFLEELDTLGFPSWDLLKPDTYKGVPNGVFLKQYPFAPIIITRGCPYLCTFCSAHNIVGRKIRSRSIDNVVREIILLHEKYGIKEIHIEDDNFTFNINFAKDFCNRLVDLKLPLTYSCPNGIRLDRIDEELLQLMKKAGFYNIYVGIESGSPKILKHMKKGLQLSEITKKINLIKKNGLEASGYFMLGYPQETLGDMRMTIEFAHSLNLDWAQFATFIPIPGSEIMNDEYLKEISKTIHWSSFFNTQVPFSPRGISREKLKNLQRYAFLKFYLRPRKILAILQKIRPENLIFILRRIVSYLFK